MKQVTIFTDGACLGNPGPGGYGVILDYNGHRKELAEGYRLTTNNRMEILAAIKGLEALKEPCEVTLFSDSQYLVRANEEGWAKRWKSNGWRRNRKEFALNSDLWERLLNLCEYHQVSFQWVRGHNGHVENERCDALAVIASKASNLLCDEEYEVSAAPEMTAI